MHVGLIVPYNKSIRQHQPAGAIIKNNVSLTYMMMIDPATGWFEIIKVPTSDLYEVTGGNDEYIDKSSARLSQLFNNTWLSRYPCPCKFVIDNGYEFKQYFTPLIRYLDIKHALTTIKNPQANDLVDRVHRVILNILVTKYIANKLFDYIDPWGETLSYIA